MADGVGCQFQPVRHHELAEYRREVVAHGVLAHKEVLCYPGGSESLRYQGDNLPLAGRQRGDARGLSVQPLAFGSAPPLAHDDVIVDQEGGDGGIRVGRYDLRSLQPNLHDNRSAGAIERFNAHRDLQRDLGFTALDTSAQVSELSLSPSSPWMAGMLGRL